MRRAFKRSRQVLAYGMKRCLKFAIGMLLLAAFTLWAADTRITLLPKLQAGQTVTYLIRYRSDKNVKTESNVVAPMAPNAAQLDAHGLLQIEILDVQQAGGKTAIHARGKFLTLDAGAFCRQLEGNIFDTSHRIGVRGFAVQKFNQGAFGHFRSLEKILI